MPINITCVVFPIESSNEVSIPCIATKRKNPHMIWRDGFAMKYVLTPPEKSAIICLESPTMANDTGIRASAVYLNASLRPWESFLGSLAFDEVSGKKAVLRGVKRITPRPPDMAIAA